MEGKDQTYTILLPSFRLSWSFFVSYLFCHVFSAPITLYFIYIVKYLLLSNSSLSSSAPPFKPLKRLALSSCSQPPPASSHLSISFLVKSRIPFRLRYNFYWGTFLGIIELDCRFSFCF